MMEVDEWTIKSGKTDAVEIRGFIGILIHLGAQNQNLFPSAITWDSKIGNKYSRLSMSRKRFMKLSNRLRFDNKETRSTRRKNNVFAPIKDVWDKFISSLKSTTHLVNA